MYSTCYARRHEAQPEFVHVTLCEQIYVKVRVVCLVWSFVCMPSPSLTRPCCVASSSLLQESSIGALMVDFVRLELEWRSALSAAANRSRSLPSKRPRIMESSGLPLDSWA